MAPTYLSLALWQLGSGDVSAFLGLFVSAVSTTFAVLFWFFIVRERKNNRL